MTYSLGDDYKTHNAILNKAPEIGLNELHSKRGIQTLRANKIHQYRKEKDSNLNFMPVF